MVEVAQHTPWELETSELFKEPYDVELFTEPTEINVLRDIQRVVGKYDLLRFIFKTREGILSKHTFLAVRSKQAGDAGKYGLPGLFLPVRIELGRMAKIILIGRVIVGGFAACIFFDSDYLGMYLKIQPDWVRSLALFALVIASSKWDELIKALIDRSKKLKIVPDS